MDECEESLHKCHFHADCTNTVGSYSCRCKPGYFGDGLTCKKGECLNNNKRKSVLVFCTDLELWCVMVKVQDDILHAIESNMAVVLLMLDSSAAFDAVYHEILLNRLSQRYGITGSVEEKILYTISMLMTLSSISHLI